MNNINHKHITVNMFFNVYIYVYTWENLTLTFTGYGRYGSALTAANATGQKSGPSENLAYLRVKSLYNFTTWMSQEVSCNLPINGVDWGYKL